MIKLEAKLIMATSVRQLSLSFCGAFFVESPVFLLLAGITHVHVHCRRTC